MPDDKLQIGDTIRCTDPDDMIEVMENLMRAGYSTDMMYQKDGERGYWLIVVGEV